MKINKYGEFLCKYDGCSAVFMSREARKRHYRRVHEYTPENEDTHAAPLSREELLNPDADA